MLHLSELGIVVVVIIAVWLIIVATLEVRKCRRLKHVDTSMLEWHWAVVEREISGHRRRGERFYDELELMEWEAQHPEVPDVPPKKRYGQHHDWGYFD